MLIKWPRPPPRFRGPLGWNVTDTETVGRTNFRIIRLSLTVAFSVRLASLRNSSDELEYGKLSLREIAGAPPQPLATNMSPLATSKG